MSVSQGGREGEAPILGGTAHASLFDKCGRHRLASLLHFFFFSFSSQLVLRDDDTHSRVFVVAVV